MRRLERLARETAGLIQDGITSRAAHRQMLDATDAELDAIVPRVSQIINRDLQKELKE